MPIDPSIPLSVRPPQVESPLAAITAVAQLQGLREQTEARLLAAEEARQKAKDAAAIRQVMTETGGDVEAALPRLRMIAPQAALTFETEMQKARKEGFDALTSQTTHRTKQLDLGTRLLQGVTDDASFQLVRPMISTLSPEVAQALGDQYDPAKVKQFLDVGLSTKELYERRQEGLKLFTEGKAAEGMGTWFSTARNQEEWDEFAKTAVELGMPRALVTQFGSFSPENVARAAQLAITPKERETLAGQAETRAQTAAHQATTEAVAQQNLGLARERVAIARQRLAQGSGTERDRSDLVQAVVDNPGLWDQITPTERGKIAGELQRQGFTGFGKPLSDAAVKQISDSESSIASLTDLREVVKRNEQYIGPLAGFQSLNPYSEGRKAQADIDRVRQRVGKTLEGGVLRKEDEEKYKKILATMFDDPKTAVYKIDQLQKDIQRDIDTYKHNQRLSGRRVPAAAAPGKDPLGIR